MTVLLAFALVFIIGFQAGALLVSTGTILTEPEREPIPAPTAGMFPSYRRYLIQRGSR